MPLPTSCNLPYIKKRISIIWVAILTYICVIYITLPVMRPLLKFLYSSIGRETLSIAVNSILLLSSIVLLILLLFRRGLFSFLLVALPVVITAVFVYTLKLPEERIHFLEYAVLGLLILKAMGKGSKSGQMAFSLLIVFIAGGIDEFIQHLLPTRVGEIRDVVMNAVGGALGVWAGKIWYR
jgi:hypothetical protein